MFQRTRHRDQISADTQEISQTRLRTLLLCREAWFKQLSNEPPAYIDLRPKLGNVRRVQQLKVGRPLLTLRELRSLMGINPLDQT